MAGLLIAKLLYSEDCMLMVFAPGVYESLRISAPHTGKNCPEPANALESVFMCMCVCWNQTEKKVFANVKQ